MGVTKEEFFDSTPNDIQCYIKAEEMRVKRRDTEAWQSGLYNLSAFSTALSKALAGKKSHAKYMEKPLLEKAREEVMTESLSEEEKEMQREKLLMSLMTMQANFELNKGREEN